MIKIVCENDTFCKIFLEYVESLDKYKKTTAKHTDQVTVWRVQDIILEK